jgi:hypothetical protein
MQASSDIENDDDKLNAAVGNEETDISLSLAAEDEETDDKVDGAPDKSAAKADQVSIS